MKKIFLIAEIGINHNGSLKKAIKLIDAAIKAGVSAVKFQTYKTELRVKKESPIFKILKKCELSNEDFFILKKYCDKKKIIFFSTPFDIKSVDFLEKIKVKLYKVSSFDISNFQLINRVLLTKKPIIFSTGMASLKEIKKIHNVCKIKKNSHALLHCISSYPTKEKDSLLGNVKFLKDNFNCKIGLSDHTNDIQTSIYSAILGAQIIEKHFKLSSNDNCVDAPVSITPNQMKLLKDKLDLIDHIIDLPKFGIRKTEKNATQFKRKKIL